METNIKDTTISNGWMGKIARVDLRTGEAAVQELSGDLAVNYIGGRGFGVRILYDEVNREVKPFDPENYLIIATGPLTGTRAPTGGRFTVSTKSPLTGTVVDSNSGGTWGVRFKGTGHDALVITGKAEQPVWLLIDETGITINDAGNLWGKDVPVTTDALLEQVAKPAASVACIGPAGENLVRFASIINDKAHAVGRGGVGAVMGSKNLKAIVACGSKKPSVADAEALEFIVYESLKAIRQSPLTGTSLPKFGTAGLIKVMNMTGTLPVRNFTVGHLENDDDISGEALRKNLLVKRGACWGCPIGCKRIIKTEHFRGEGPEYETLWALGPECGVNDLTAITDANHLCNRLGLDTISTGVTIGCAMEMAEQGIIDFPARFGDVKTLLTCIDDIAYRRGWGDELAEGSLRLAEKHGAVEYAMQVKGMELPAYEPRAMGGQGLGFATSNRGACHLRGNLLGAEILGVPKMLDRSADEGRAGYLINQQHISAVFDSVGICKFAGFVISTEHIARMLSAVTGITFYPYQLHETGELIWNLERLFNIREGFTNQDDTLPRRLLEEKLTEGPAKGRTVNLAPVLADYYRIRSWDENGVPTEGKLKRLGLQEQ